MIFGSKPSANTPAKRRFMNTPNRTPLKARKVGPIFRYCTVLLLCISPTSFVGVDAITKSAWKLVLHFFAQFVTAKKNLLVRF